MTAGRDVRRKLRIWLPTIRANSGADVFAVRLQKALLNAGHEPLLQWFDHRFELMPWRLRRVVAPVDIDIVHAGSWQGFAFKREGIPLVITEHQYVAHPDFAPYRSIPQMLYHKLCCERWAGYSYQAADTIVAVSEYCAIAMRSDIAKPISVIHNWVDTSIFSPSALRLLEDDAEQRSARPFRLLFVGNPSRWKGADLIPVIASMLGPTFEIQCLGGLREGFKREQWPANIKFVPRTDPAHMPSLYRSFDAALVPTRYEAFGYVALEAMACGLPVLGFNSSGTSEVCVQGTTALLAPVDDIELLVGYAWQLKDNRNLRNSLGEAGRQRAVDYFGENKGVASYLDVYNRILQLDPDSD
ncbi:MAG: glycosyltransferase family 4 protein [Pseudoxanthomonas sp.]